MRTVPVKGWESHGGERAPRGKRKVVSHKPRTVDLLTQAGWLVDDCERRDTFKSVPAGKDASGRTQWNRIPGGQKRDLFGVADLAAIDNDDRPVLVQICSASTVAAHKRTITQLAKTQWGVQVDPLRLVKAYRVVIVAWDKAGDPGRWRARYHELVADESLILTWTRDPGEFQKQKGQWVYIPPEGDLAF